MQNTRLILITFVAIALFLGGIVLLLSPVKFWSLFLGIPATQAGIVFLILAFEKLTKDSLDNENLKPFAYMVRAKGKEERGK